MRVDGFADRVVVGGLAQDATGEYAWALRALDLATGSVVWDECIPRGGVNGLAGVGNRVFAAGFLTGGRFGPTGRHPDAPAARTAVDLTTEFTIQPRNGPVRAYRPYAVHSDNRRVFVGDPPADDAPTVVVRFESNRVQVAAVELSP